MNRLGTSKHGTCVNCGGTVVVQKKSFNIIAILFFGIFGLCRDIKGGVCTKCGARYTKWNVMELEPKPQFRIPANQ